MKASLKIARQLRRNQTNVERTTNNVAVGERVRVTFHLSPEGLCLRSSFCPKGPKVAQKLRWFLLALLVGIIWTVNGGWAQSQILLWNCLQAPGINVVLPKYFTGIAPNLLAQNIIVRSLMMTAVDASLIVDAGKKQDRRGRHWIDSERIDVGIGGRMEAGAP